MKRDIAIELFQSYRIKNYRKSNTESTNRDHLTEPGKLSNILEELVREKDWRKGLADGSLFTNWAEIVGAEVSEHCEPITLLDGRLTVQARSTAWATQLKLLSHELLKRIQSHPSGASTEEIFIIGPTTPSWRRGARTIRGARGPRDTYG